MRSTLLVSFCFSSLFASSSAQAFQLQYRAFQSLARLSHKGGEFPTEWNGAYLKGPPQTTSLVRGADASTLNTLGHELSVGSELYYPYVYMDVGISQASYYPGPDEKIEDLAPKAGLQFITNVQDRWMPFVRLGITQHHLKLISNRVQTRELPAALNLSSSTDRFGVEKTWNNPRIWNGDLSLGCKLYPVPTTAIVVEYRYSNSLSPVTIREKESGTSSYQNEAGFISERRLYGTRLTSQELSLAIEVEL